MKKRKQSRSKVSAKVKKSIDEDSWRAALNDISLNDDDWWCIVTMMVETITNDSKFVSLFNIAAEEGKRRAIYSLNYQKMLSSVKTLSRQSLDKCPPAQGVCHYASKVLNEDNGTLPTLLMALVIKFLIYRTKEKTIGIVKRLADLDREVDEEYQIMQTIANWGQMGSKGFDAEKFNNKANTRLRKCDEEWRNAIYVEDAPLNGPNLYVILTGFSDPNLPEHLISVGVPLTFILPIKQSNKELDLLTGYETTQEEPLEARSPLHFNNYENGRLDLFKFWTTIEARVMDPKTYPSLCDVAFVTFRPPKLPNICDDDEWNRLQKDLYDRVSYFVYGLYDLYRQHAKYLKAMQVEKRIVDESEKKCDMQIYETLLDAVPQECVSTPVILFAMLVQIEANEKASNENTVDAKNDANVLTKTSTGMGTKPKSTSQSPLSFVEQKVKTLNAKFELDEEYNANDKEQTVTDIELILREDILHETIRLLDDSTNFHVTSRSDLIDNILPIFFHPNITNLHSKHEISEKKLEEYTRHIDKTRRYFDVETSNEEVKHYLHILMFDRMIFGKFQRENETSKDTNERGAEDSMDSDGSSFSIGCSKSVSISTSKYNPEIHFHSDGNIDYGKIPSTFFDCFPLFDLVDLRELLVPGYLQEHVFDARFKGGPDLTEFDDVEPLTKSIFLQSLYQCLHSFDTFKVLYFEPTDSVLLFFGNEWKVNGIDEEERISSIRTPVRLRDFCEYVVAEEEDWIRREEEIYRLQTSESMGRLMKKASEIHDGTLLFRDEDFILPKSLKARDLEKSDVLAIEKEDLDRDTHSRSTAQERTERSKKGKGRKKNITKEEEKKKFVVDEESTLSTKEESLLHVAETEATYEFIGYDLSQLRVHLRNNKKTFFSEDGTLVRVELDDWIYKKDLRITVTLRGCSLRLFHRIGAPESSKVFHLTSSAGIILAFQKLRHSEHTADNLFKDCLLDRSLDFRASWQTGLLIEPIIGDNHENPFYIRQSYIPKGYNNTNGDNEVRRKFLRNGTILKYLDDGKIIVLRPNGVIVTCIAFEELHVNEDAKSMKETDFATGDRPSRGLKLSSKSKRKPTRSSKSQLPGVVEQDPVLAQQDSTTNYGSSTLMTDTMVKVSRYTVLNHDGRQYEVLDDLVVSEHHRLLVRTASDYEVDEKFTRRADGTDMLLNSNGELIVEFPDGTRITTGYTIEKEPVMCDWTEEEILLYFTSFGTKEEEEEEGYGGASSSNVKFHKEASSRPFAEYDGDITEILIADSFVSVLLTCRAEHKNYATVFYDQSAVSCTLSMPDDLRVSISRRGHYKVSMADGVNLKIEEHGLSFEGKACATCGSQSTSTYNFFAFESPAVIFTTIDVCGNIFEVMDDGTTRYRRKRQPSGRRESSSYVDVLESNKEEESYEGTQEERSEENENSKRKHGCDHERLRFGTRASQYRLFSMNRDLTAYEYLHRSVRNQAELAAVFDNETSVILYPTSRRPELRRLITFEMVKPESRSKALLSFQERKLKPTNCDREHLIRSTYSIPYDWLFPFGKNDNGIWKNTHDIPLTTDNEMAVPELLNTRILYGFKRPGGNAVIDIQRALGRYWMSLTARDEPRSTDNEESKITQIETKTRYEYMEVDLHDLALGIKKTIDVATYRSGFEKHREVPRVMARRKSIKFDELLEQKASKREEFEWYKRCFRERFILPYFENIAGSCFLLVQECAERVPKISSANQSVGELDESEKIEHFDIDA